MMRRSERKITDQAEILSIMERCMVCHLALNDGDSPYVIPLNFGLALEKENIVLYFHGARTGKKMDLIRQDPRASFSMVGAHRPVWGGCACEATMEYESVCGTGVLCRVEESEKEKALQCLMKHTSGKGNWSFSKKETAGVTVLKLTVKELSGKAHRRPGGAL